MLVDILRNLSSGVSLKIVGAIIVLIVFLILVIVSYLILSRFWSGNYQSKLKKFKQRLGKYLPIIAIGLVINYLFLVLFYAFTSTFSDQIEPTIASISWLFYNGEPIYHSQDSAQQYSMLYGPILYVLGGFLLGLFQPTIFSAKLLGVLPATGSLVVLVLAFRKMIGIKTGIICLGFISLIMIAGPLSLFSTIFWSRPDPLILFLVSLSLLSILIRGSGLAGLIYGICLGLATNLKIHAFLYFLPFFLVLNKKHGFKSTLLALGISALTFIAPFLIFHQISIGNYIFWLFHLFSGQGLGFIESTQNLTWSLYLIVPNLILLIYLFINNRKGYKLFIYENRGYLYSLVFTLVAVIYFASIRGGGMNHLIPLIPVVSYCFMLLLKQVGSIQVDAYYFVAKFKWIASILISLGLTLLLSCSILGISNEIAAIAALSQSSTPIIEDLNQIMIANPNTTIEMGYGDISSYPSTFPRPILVFAGNPYSFDAPALMVSAGRVDLPDASLTLLRTCQTKIWLIPKGAEPFTLPNLNLDKPLFEERFRETFLNHYQLREQTSFFDVWHCK
jgi:hypothetical protein